MDKKRVVGFITFWIVNSIVILLAGLVWSGNIVLGNVVWSPVAAAIVTGLILTALTYLVAPVVKQLKIKLNEEYIWSLIYLVVNVVGLWFLARLANYTGFGIASFWVAIILGVILTVEQWAVWKYLPKIVKLQKLF